MYLQTEVLSSLDNSNNVAISEARLLTENQTKCSLIDPCFLSSFQRILLTTDGSITDILESYSRERIKLIKLSEEITDIETDILPMQLKKGEKVIKRNILLRGKISQKNYIYAESIIVPNRLEERFRRELLTTKTPIGKLWYEQKVETFKEIITTGKYFANQLASYFQIDPQDKMIFRTYCVISNQKYTMMITEHFPEVYFTDKL